MFESLTGEEELMAMEYIALKLRVCMVNMLHGIEFVDID